MSKSYSEKSIKRFAGLAGIQRKSTIYIGQPDNSALWTVFREPGDNAVDQALAERNKLVHMIVDPNGKGYWILDAGPGIPVGANDYHDEHGRSEKLSTLYVATGLTHGGGNFDGDNVSRGTHGIGIKATNATSVVFSVWTHRDGRWYYIEYKKGKLSNDAARTKPQSAKGPPKLPHGIKIAKGTAVYFEPDLDGGYFGKKPKMPMDEAQSWCQLTSYLVAGLEVKLTDAKGKTQTFKSKNGPVDYVNELLADQSAEALAKPLVLSTKEIDLAFAFANTEGSGLDAFTNGLSNDEGGKHYDAVYDALTASLKPYKGKLEYTPADLREGTLGLVNAKLAAPQFSNQVKSQLVDERIYPLAYPQILKAFEEYFAKNKTLAKDLCTRAAELRKKTADFLKDKKLARNINAAKKKLSTKLADIQGSKYPVSERELLLVEGDSASGTAKRARDKGFQAVYPLKGKPLNVMETTKDKVNSNVEIAGLLAALGLDTQSDDILKSIRYGKVVFMTDADVDGNHINVLLLTLFYKYLPSMFEAGRVFILMCPEYLTRYKSKTYFGYTKDELYKQTGSQKIDITHLKGLGELNDVDLRAMAMIPGQRKLVKLKPLKDKAEKQEFERLMGKDSTYRKKLMGVN